MTEHTPGPWGYDEELGEVFYDDRDTTGKGVMPRIATIDLGNVAPFYQALADGNLIAAAPDLLAAVRAILFQTSQGAVFDRDACIAQARAAFNKATGKQTPAPSVAKPIKSVTIPLDLLGALCEAAEHAARDYESLSCEDPEVSEKLICNSYREKADAAWTAAEAGRQAAAAIETAPSVAKHVPAKPAERW